MTLFHNFWVFVAFPAYVEWLFIGTEASRKKKGQTKADAYRETYWRRKRLYAKERFLTKQAEETRDIKYKLKRFEIKRQARENSRLRKLGLRAWWKI